MSDLSDFKRHVYEPQRQILRAVQAERDALLAENERLREALESTCEKIDAVARDMARLAAQDVHMPIQRRLWAISREIPLPSHDKRGNPHTSAAVPEERG